MNHQSKRQLVRQSLGWSIPIAKHGNIVAPVKLHKPAADHLSRSKSKQNRTPNKKEEKACTYWLKSKMKRHIDRARSVLKRPTSDISQYRPHARSINWFFLWLIDPSFGKIAIARAFECVLVAPLITQVNQSSLSSFYKKLT